MTFDERRIRQLLWAAFAVVGLGLWAFLLVGADEPADPYLPGTGALPPGVAPPGDPARVPLEGFDEIAVTVTPAAGGDLVAWCLLAAIQAEQRARGLMGVTDLRGYPGMAFLYDRDVDHSFYMRNTPMPLSIAWIGKSGGIVSITDMAPCEDREGCPLYAPGGRYRNAIEVPQGALPMMRIEPGATVTIGGACASRA